MHIRPEDEIAKIDEIVVLICGELSEGGVRGFVFPMSHRGGRHVEQPVRKKSRPSRVAKTVKVHAPTKRLEHPDVRRGDALLVETEKINRVAKGELVEEVERALKRSSCYRIRRVGINDEDAHGIMRFIRFRRPREQVDLRSPSESYERS